MRMRYNTLKAQPMMLSEHRAKGEAVRRERERATRLVLEFGIVTGGVDTSAVAFVRVVRSADGSTLRKGMSSKTNFGGELVASVSLGGTSLGPFQPMLSAPNAQGGAYGFPVPVSRSHEVRCKLTVKWNEQVFMNPLELHISTSDGEPFKRRAVIQMPQGAAIVGGGNSPHPDRLGRPPLAAAAGRSPPLGRSPMRGIGPKGGACGRTPESSQSSPARRPPPVKRPVLSPRAAQRALDILPDDEPVVFTCEDDGVTSNGWVLYHRVQGNTGGAATKAQANVQGVRSHKNRTQAEEKVTNEAKLARQWITRLAEDTDALVDAALGSLNAVLRCFLQGAWKGLRLEELATGEAALEALRHSTQLPEAGNLQPNGQPDGELPMLLMDLAQAASPAMAQAYTATLDFIRSDPLRGQRLTELFNDRHGDDSARPSTFFQVAVDLPAFSLSAGGKAGPGSVLAGLLADLCMSLGKKHAYAIVAHGGACNAALQSVIESPSLSSFLVLRDPEVKETLPLHSVLQPTLLLADTSPSTDKSPPCHASARKLTAEMQQISWPRSRPEVTEVKETAAMLVDFFQMNNWMGIMPTDGADESLALLTRLTGGLRAYKGTRVRSEQPMAVRVSNYWTKIRASVRLGTLWLAVQASKDAGAMAGGDEGGGEEGEEEEGGEEGGDWERRGRGADQPWRPPTISRDWR